MKRRSLQYLALLDQALSPLQLHAIRGGDKKPRPKVSRVVIIKKPIN